jgi:hypothetical protein
MADSIKYDCKKMVVNVCRRYKFRFNHVNVAKMCLKRDEVSKILHATKKVIINCYKK